MTVFRSRLREEARDAYDEHAERMDALADTMPGLLERKAFIAADGERLTLVTFADRASHDAWRDRPEHLQAQRAGVRSYYECYSIAVATTEHTSSFERSDRTSGG
ncbi:MAG: antibiotic biosynthesis monooxygenase family protein [Sporichthyaceae bacterium]